MQEERQSDEPLIRLVDDDEADRQALTFMLESYGWKVAPYADAMAFLVGDRPSVPGCLVLDVRMPGMSGLELQQEMNRRGMTLPIVFLTGHGDVPMAVGAMQKGAVNFLLKPIEAEAFNRAVNQAVAKTQGRLGMGGTPRDCVEKYRQLSERQQEIMEMLAEGKLNREIARELKISERTVEGHRYNAFKLLGVKNRSELVQLMSQVQAFLQSE